MPANLQALLRHRIIDESLRKPGRWSWKALAQACASAFGNDDNRSIRPPSRRTILKDLEDMRSGYLGYRAPISYNHRLRSYQYDDSSFTIHQVPLRQEELDELGRQLRVLEKIYDHHQISVLAELIRKLAFKLNLEADFHADEILIFDQSLNESGQKWLNTVYSSTEEKIPALVSYKPFVFEEETFLFSPYFIREYNSRYYVFGWNHHLQAIRNLALDRIKNWVPSIQPFYHQGRVDGEKYLQNTIGVSLGDHSEPVLINLKVFPPQNNYLITKPWHRSQKVINSTPECDIISLEVIPNFELENLILGQGEKIEVLEPGWLREKINQRIKSMLDIYDNL